MRKLLCMLLSAWMMISLLCAGAQAEGLGASLMLLASADEPLPADYAPEDLKQISPENRGVNLVTSRAMFLREEALEALYRLMQAADRAGVTLYVRQAYRSYADEARRYELLSGTGQAAQKPGESSYQTGLSVTLVGEKWRTEELTAAFADSKEAKWLSQHAAEYGFVLRYPKGKENATGWTYEPWHYRYVGVETAAIMTAQELCLEELAGSGMSAEAIMLTVEEETEAPGDTDEPDEPEDDLLPEDTDEPEALDEPEETKRPSTGHRVPQTTPSLNATGEVGPDGDYEISLFGN